MRRLYLLILLLILVSGCVQKKSFQNHPLDYISASTDYVLEIRDPEDFRSGYTTNPFLQGLKQTKSYASYDSLISRVLELPINTPFYLTLEQENLKNWQVIIPHLKKTPADSLIVADSILSPETQTALDPRVWDSLNLKALELDGITLVGPALKHLDSLQFAPSEVQEMSLVTLQQMADLNSPASLYYKAFSSETPKDSISELQPWNIFDLQLERESLTLKGLLLEKNPTAAKSYFKEVPPVAASLLRIIPQEAESLSFYSLSNTDQYLENLTNGVPPLESTAAIIGATNSVALVQIEGSFVFIMQTYTGDFLSEWFSASNTSEANDLGYQIDSIESDRELRKAFEPILENLPALKYYSQLEDYILFSPALEPLEQTLSAYNRGAVLSSSTKFNQLQQTLWEESTITHYRLKDSGQQSIPFQPLSSEWIAALPEDYLYSEQTVAENKYFHQLIHLEKAGSSKTNEGPAISFITDLDTLAASPPVFLKNHLNNTFDIAVQDLNNMLYLLNFQGEILWKKPLSGRIQGRIQQLDLYKNGKLQMAFTTSSELLVLDRNGEAVAPFPKTFEGGNLLPLSLFDYEGNKNYRLLVCQGSKVFMFDAQGREVTGFTYKEAPSNILLPPRHIRMGSRDYLVFQLEDGSLKILSRTGKERVKVDGTFQFSNNPVYHYRDFFVFTDVDGNLFRIDTRGGISKREMNLNADHGIDATTKSLVVMNDNILNIKGQLRELELGVYTRPQIFYLFDIIYVAVTDLQSQRLELFTSNTETLAGFPVEANSPADMADSDGDRIPDLVTLYRKDAVIGYKLHR